MERTGQLVPQHGQGYLGNIHTHSRTVGSLLNKDFSETSLTHEFPQGGRDLNDYCDLSLLPLLGKE